MEELEKTILKAGFKPSSNSVGQMFILDSKMWKHEQEGYYLTDYEITNDTSLKEKNLLMLFYYLKGVHISILITPEMITHTPNRIWFDSFQDRVNRSLAATL